jgi:hypothetical protein
VLGSKRRSPAAGLESIGAALSRSDPACASGVHTPGPGSPAAGERRLDPSSKQ